MRNIIMSAFYLVGICYIAGCHSKNANLVREPYLLDTGLLTRSVSAENPTGESGKGGTAESYLGVGRKGKPNFPVEPGQTVLLCDIEGPGVIRHIWMTSKRDNLNLRKMVIRAYYDDQSYPSIECPLGDFMGFAHGLPTCYNSAVHSVSGKGGMNMWLPMPFVKKVRMTITNEGSERYPVYCSVDYTVGDKLPDDVGRLHVLFRRENPTTPKQDFEILPERHNKGRYIGAVLGIHSTATDRQWYEGEFKVYMDGDTDFPTICGSGSEDYVGLAWGVQPAQFTYNGCSLADKGYVSMYRWHLPDPIAWQKQCRITIQQIGFSQKRKLVNAQDDWSSATFWYEPLPSKALPSMPDINARTADLSELLDKLN
jgi:hypothetical protein